MRISRSSERVRLHFIDEAQKLNHTRTPDEALLLSLFSSNRRERDPGNGATETGDVASSQPRMSGYQG